MNSSQCLSEFLDQSAKEDGLIVLSERADGTFNKQGTNDVTLFKTINIGLKMTNILLNGQFTQK